MNAAWRHRLRRARFALTIALGVVVIGAAAAVAVVQLALPLAVRHPDFVARQLADRLHRPVRFASIRSEWQPAGPLLTVRDLTLGPGRPGGQSITLPQAALKFDFRAWLRPEHRWITLRAHDIELRLEYTAGGWHVAGFGSSAGASHTPLQSLPVDLDFVRLRVDLVDEVDHRTWRVTAPHLRVVNVGQRLRFGGTILQDGTGAPVRIAGTVDAAARAYELYLAARGFDFAGALRGMEPRGYALRSAHGDLELWAGWRAGRLASVAARYTLQDVAASGPGGAELRVPSLAGVVRATRERHIWHFAFRRPGTPGADLDRAGGIIGTFSGTPGARAASLAARNIDLAPWLPFLALVPQAPAALVGWAGHAGPRLTVDRAAFAWQQGGRYDATVRFSGLRAAASGRIPGLVLRRGTLRFDPDAATLELPPQPATLALADVFRQPLVFTNLGGDLVAWRRDGAWNLATDGLRFDTGTLAGAGDAHLVLRGAGRAPFLSAYVTLDHARAADAKLFWTPRTMSPVLVHWLDRALVAGEITSGRALIRGDLGDWPFRDHAGRFEAAGVLAGATFHFADGWPDATGLDAAVDFIDNHMGVVATRARVRGLTATHAVATIPDLSHGVLGLDIDAAGTGAELLDFVRNSPIGADAAGALEGITLGGTGNARVELSIPLDDAAKFTLGGRVQLANADVSAPKWNLALRHLTGPLVLRDRGFCGTDLAVGFRGAPATFSLAVGSGVADPADIVEGSLDTRASLQTLAQGYPALDGLLAHVHGVAPFHVAVAVPAAAQGPALPVLTVQSSLVGVALDFPAPLQKPADAAWPLDLRLPLPPNGATLTASLGGLLQVRGRLADAATHAPLAFAAEFGTTPPGSVPARGLVIGGHAPTLDVGGWIQEALAAGSGGDGPPLTGADVTTDAASVFGTDFGALQFTFAASAEADAIRLDGTNVAGTVSVPTRSVMTRGITARLARLDWPEPAPPATPATPTPPSRTSPIAPSAVPPLDVEVKDFRLGRAHFGTTILQSAPSPAGMHIARFDVQGSDFTIRSHGDWNGSRADSHSHLIADLTMHDFGDALGAFGFSGLLAGGKDAHVHIDGTWPGSPAGFSLGWTDGTLDVKVGEGRILAVKPGLGRLLGLLSVSELPSRLTLHFGDVFKSGFGFDHAEAHFELRDGSAYTKDLVIKAPAAQITMRGRTGVRIRDYQLVVEVVPHVGGTLPVVGAVVGGPVGAAAGLVVQGLLGKGINKAAGSIYQVTGSWEKPKITTLASVPVSAGAAPMGFIPAPASASSAASAASAGPAATSSGGR